MFGFGIQAEFSRAMFEQMPKRDQDEIMQKLYDRGYSVPDVARLTGIPAPTIYSRISARRGRGPQLATS